MGVGEGGRGSLVEDACEGGRVGARSVGVGEGGRVVAWEVVGWASAGLGGR